MLAHIVEKMGDNLGNGLWIIDAGLVLHLAWYGCAVLFMLIVFYARSLEVQK